MALAPPLPAAVDPPKQSVRQLRHGRLLAARAGPRDAVQLAPSGSESSKRSPGELRRRRWADARKKGRELQVSCKMLSCLVDEERFVTGIWHQTVFLLLCRSAIGRESRAGNTAIGHPPATHSVVHFSSQRNFSFPSPISSPRAFSPLRKCPLQAKLSAKLGAIEVDCIDCAHDEEGRLADVVGRGRGRGRGYNRQRVHGLGEDRLKNTLRR